MSVLNLSTMIEKANVFKVTPHFADMRTTVVPRPVVRNNRLLVFPQRVRFFADMRTTSPLRGDALSAIPQRAEGRATRSAESQNRFGGRV